MDFLSLHENGEKIYEQKLALSGYYTHFSKVQHDEEKALSQYLRGDKKAFLQYINTLIFYKNSDRMSIDDFNRCLLRLSKDIVSIRHKTILF